MPMGVSNQNGRCFPDKDMLYAIKNKNIRNFA